jgi:hypothetical protein
MVATSIDISVRGLANPTTYSWMMPMHCPFQKIRCRAINMHEAIGLSESLV